MQENDFLNQLSSFERKEDGIWNENAPTSKAPPTITTIIPLVKKFIYLAKKSTEIFRFKSLTEKSMTLLGDACHFSLNNEFTKKQKTV